MLSTRGREYADLDLAAGYLKERGPLYDRLQSPTGLVCMANAENFVMRDRVLRFIQDKCAPSLDVSALTYHDGPFGSKRLRSAMAAFVNANLGPAAQVTMEEVTFVAGVTALNSILARCLTEEGDGLLLGIPIYGSFVPDLQTTSKCKLVYTPFGDVDQFSVRAIACYERALEEAEHAGTKVRALVLTNPHNPLGRCYPRDTLEAIVRFCVKHDVHLISDEIYALSVYRTGDSLPGFTSVLSIDLRTNNAQNLVHVMYGVSKDLAAAGLRLGCLITKNPDLTKAVQSLAFHGASPVTDAFATTILEDQDFHTRFLSASRLALRQHRDVVAKAFDDAGIPYIRNANAGFFLWFNMSACLSQPTWEAEDELRLELYEHGIEMSSGHAYHAEMPGWFRFIFSVERETLEEGLRRVVSFNAKNAKRSR